MKVRDCIIQIVITTAIILFSFIFVYRRGVWDSVLFFKLSGGLTMLVFFLFMIYNPYYNDISKPKRVISGWKMVENENRHHFDPHNKTTKSIYDSMGYGFTIPNIISFGLGLLLFLMGTIL